MSNNIETVIKALGDCRKMIPGGSNPADAAAADYLIRRLRGEQVGGSVVVLCGDMVEMPRFVVDRTPSAEDLW